MEKNRSTRQKQLILSILKDAAVPLTAREIYIRGTEKEPLLAKSTVYRNLEAMLARGELTHGRLETGESFYALVDEHAHKHYMICKDCNAMLDLPECPLGYLEKQLAETADFTVTDHVIQLYGYCCECRKKHIPQQ